MWRIELTAILVVSVLCCISAKEFEITKLDVPEYAHRNRDVTLSCILDLKGQSLDTVSWLFNNSEFYRHTEERHIRQQLFPGTSLRVDIDNSNATSVTLRSVSLEASGDYKCSVNTDHPEFQTKEETKHMEVVVIPDEMPTMDEIPEKAFSIGTMLPINCTSAPSKPAANLTFEANNRKIPTKHIKNYVVEKTNDGLFITKATLLLKLNVYLLRDKKVNVVCFSKIEGFEMASSLAVVKGSGETTRWSLEIIIVSLMLSLGR